MQWFLWFCEIKGTGCCVFDLVYPAKCFSRAISNLYLSNLTSSSAKWHEEAPSFCTRGDDILWLGKMNIGGMKPPFARTLQITVRYCLASSLWWSQHFFVLLEPKWDRGLERLRFSFYPCWRCGYVEVNISSDLVNIVKKLCHLGFGKHHSSTSACSLWFPSTDRWIYL